MAGPGTKRTNSPGALHQTPPNQPQGVRLGDPCWETIGLQQTPEGALIRRTSPCKTSRHKAPGSPLQPSKSPALAEVPSNPGGPSRNSAMPVLGVRGEGVPAILCHEGRQRTLAPLPPPASLHACWERPGTVGRKICRGKTPRFGLKPTTVPGHTKKDLCPIRRRQPIGVCAPSPALPLHRLHAL